MKTQQNLAQHNADELYAKLKLLTGSIQDPCVWDVFAAIIHEAQTGEKLPWCYWSKIRKSKVHQ